MTTAELVALLRTRTPDNAAALDAEIMARATRRAAVLMCDAAGFTRSVREHGILPFLELLVRCYDGLLPLIERHRGVCLSKGADNLLALFDRPEDAVSAAVDMNLWLRGRNEGRAAPEQLRICIGIHYGDLILVDDGVFGEVVNIASKVGEDVAGAEEVLVTRQVREAVDGRHRLEYSRSTVIGGDQFELYRVAF